MSRESMGHRAARRAYPGMPFCRHEKNVYPGSLG
jgi:hypothetical protein